jgi:hypothetical protein
VKRSGLIINGIPVEAMPQPAYRPAPVPPRPSRPGANPECCGAIGAGNGGHDSDCSWRSKPSRVFDHFAGGEPEDRRFGAVARAMRGELWWLRESVHVTPSPVAGEICDGVPVASATEPIS